MGKQYQPELLLLALYQQPNGIAMERFVISNKK